MGILELGSLQLTLFAMMLVGVLYTSIFLIPMRIVMWSAGTTYFVAGETVEKRKAIKNVLTYPCLVAIYLGLLCMVTQVQLPSMILNTVKYIGNCNSALTMFIVGTTLTDAPLKSIVSRDTVKFSLLRLALLPAAALGVGLLLHLEPTVLGVECPDDGHARGRDGGHLCRQIRQRRAVRRAKCRVHNAFIHADAAAVGVCGGIKTGFLFDRFVLR